MYQSEVHPLRRVVMKHARDAFVGPERIAQQWIDLGYAGEPDYDAACRESDELGALLERLGTEVEWLSAADVGLDSVYVRDASVLTDGGAVLCRMGKEARREEPAAHGVEYPELGIHVVGSVEPPGTLEGGDVTWLGPETLLVGRGYRTNDDGIRHSWGSRRYWKRWCGRASRPGPRRATPRAGRRAR